VEPGSELLGKRLEDLLHQRRSLDDEARTDLFDERERLGPARRRRRCLAGGEPCGLIGRDHSVRQRRPVRGRDHEPNGRARKVVGSATKRQSAGGPDYAPSGTRLAWYRVTYNKNGQGFAASDLFVRNGTHNTNITRRSSAKFFSVSWAPNGKGLIAIRGQRTLVWMRPDGSGARVLTSVSGANTGLASAVYSPDGTKIAYLQCAGDCGDPQLQGQGSIWVMNANGSRKQRIYNGGNGVQPADRLSWSVS
jgi:hypothetical protein